MNHGLVSASLPHRNLQDSLVCLSPGCLHPPYICPSLHLCIPWHYRHLPIPSKTKVKATESWWLKMGQQESGGGRQLSPGHAFPTLCLLFLPSLNLRYLVTSTQGHLSPCHSKLKKVLKSGKAPRSPLLLQPQGGIAQHLMAILQGLGICSHVQTHTTSHTAYVAPCCGLNVFPEFMRSGPTTKGMVPPCGLLQVGTRLW